MDVECSQEDHISTVYDINNLYQSKLMMENEPQSFYKQSSNETYDCLGQDFNVNAKYNALSCERDDGLKQRNISNELSDQHFNDQFEPITQKMQQKELINETNILNRINNIRLNEEKQQSETEKYSELVKNLAQKQVNSNDLFAQTKQSVQEISYYPIGLANLDDEKQSFVSSSVKNFSSENILKVFSSQNDVLTIQKEIPERFQLLLGSLCDKDISENEMNFLKRWIYSNLLVEKCNQITIEKIENVLNLVLKQKMEILTIWNNEKNFIPNISLEELWKIFNLLIHYKDEIYYPRSRNDEVIIEIYSIRQISNAVSCFMNISTTKKEFNDIQLYFNYLKCCYDIKSRQLSEIQPDFLKVINQARECNIPQTIYSFFEESSSCAEMLLPLIFQNNSQAQSFIFELQDKNQTNYSQQENNMVFQSEEEFINLTLKNQQSKQISSMSLSELVQDYICLDFLHNPIIKKYITDFYYKYAVLSTKPQANINNYNIYHQYFSVKKILKKPLNLINDGEYLMIIQAVQQNLIDCEIQLKWQVENTDDLIYEQLKQYFQPKLAQKSEELKHYVENLLHRLLKDYLYPYAQNEMSRILEERSLNDVKSICVQKFKEYISYGPYLTKDRQDNFNRPETILSFYVNGQTGLIGASMINSSGKEVYKNTIEYFFDNETNFEQKKEQEIKNLYEFIRNRQPHVIIISSNCTYSLILKSLLYAQFKNLCRNIVMTEQTMMNCYLSQTKQFESPKDKIIFLAKKQAKCFSYRLQEVCQLWSYEQNPILEMNFHPYQKKLDQRDLQIRFEQVIQERICKDGLDFKNIQDQSSPIRGFLQFIPGFGPKKSHYFLNQFDQQKDPKSVNSRLKCIELNLMGQNLQMNSLAFLKFTKSDNILDQTKIPYKQYFIVEKIAELIEMQLSKQSINNEQSENKSFNEILSFITKNMDILSEIDLYNYSKQLDIHFKRSNMIIILDKIIDELKNISNQNNNTIISTDMSLQQIFNSIFQYTTNSLRRGALLQMKLRHSTEKYLEFESIDNKLTGRLMKSEIPRGLNVEIFFEKDKNEQIDLVLESIKVLDNPCDNQNQIDFIFDNKLSLYYPNYEQIAKQFVSEFNQSNKYFGELELTDLPSTRIDLCSQFNNFYKDIDLNENNTIDLSGNLNFTSSQLAQQQLQSWGNFIKANKSQGCSQMNNRCEWGNSLSSNTSANKSIGHGANKIDNSPSPNKHFNQNENNSWGRSIISNAQLEKQDGWGEQSLSNYTNGQGSTLHPKDKSVTWSSNKSDTQFNQNTESGLGQSIVSKTKQVVSDGWGQQYQQNTSSGQKQLNNDFNTSLGYQNHKNLTDVGEGSSYKAEKSNQGFKESSSRQTGQSNCSGESRNRNQSNNRNREGGNGDNGGNGCFRCGKEGHMSKDCIEPFSGKKGCFKCGKEGHFSRECMEQQQNVRNSIGACFRCNQEGHMSKECPNLQQQQKRNQCFTCGREGHLSKDCTGQLQTKKLGLGGGICFNCNQDGHFSRECPNPQKKNGCFNCGEEGHLSRNCTNQQKLREIEDGGMQKKGGCFKCGQNGHISKDCPQNKCFNCNQEGHMSRDCQKKRGYQDEKSARNKSQQNRMGFKYQ